LLVGFHYTTSARLQKSCINGSYDKHHVLSCPGLQLLQACDGRFSVCTRLTRDAQKNRQLALTPFLPTKNFVDVRHMSTACGR